MKYYYINLNESIDRRNNMINFFTKLQHFINKDIIYQRIEAFNGKTENIDNYLINCKFIDLKSTYFEKGEINCNNLKIKVKNLNKVELNKSEFGCLYSHFKALDTFVKSNEEVSIICEDDLDSNFFYNSNYLKNELDRLSKIINNYGIISLSCVGNIDLINKILNNPNKSLLFKFCEYFFYGTGCYMINRNTAIEILNRYSVIKDNILKLKFDNTNLSLTADNFIYSQSNTHFYIPSLFFTKNFKSLIDNNIKNQLQVQNIMKNNIPNFKKHVKKKKTNKNYILFKILNNENSR